MMPSDYTNLNEHIHAPKELKAQVLAAALKSGKNCGKGKKRTQGRYSRGWSALQKAAVAAVLVLCLPLTAYAAVKGFGLLEHMTKMGLEEPANAQVLVNSGQDIAQNLPTAPESAPQANVEAEEGLAVCRLDSAELTVLEAVCDSQTIYVRARVKSLDPDLFLIPGGVFTDDNVDYLGIEGVSGCTVQEYCDREGKQLCYASARYEADVVTEDFHYNPDGTYDLYLSSGNPSGAKEITLKTIFSFTPVSGEGKQWKEFEIKLQDKSTSDKKQFTTIDPAAKQDTGVDIRQLTLEETEMGLYATFVFDDSEAKFEDIDFKIVDASGQELPWMPDVIGNGTIDNGDGTWSRSIFYQKPASQDGLQFMIKEIGVDTKYGPYSFGN